MKVCVLDLETTIDAKEQVFAATPFGGQNNPNRIIAIGYCVTDVDINSLSDEQGREAYYYGPYLKEEVTYELFHEESCIIPVTGMDGVIDAIQSSDVVVAHNIQFDLGHLMNYRYKKILEALAAAQIWDTAKGHYILKGQYTPDGVSLEQCCVDMNIDFTKDLWVSSAFKEGYGADRIHPQLLSHYLKEDVSSTLMLFVRQLGAIFGGRKKEQQASVLAWYFKMMRSILATLEMTRNGYEIDRARYDFYKSELQTEVERLKEDLDSMLETSAILRACGDDAKLLEESAPYDLFNVNSDKTVSTVLFGGELDFVIDKVKVDPDGNPLTYKSGAKKGQFKTRKEKVSVPIKGMVTGSVNSLERTRSGHISVSSSQLERLLKAFVLSTNCRVFVEELLKYRQKSKSLSTYFEGLKKHFHSYRELEITQVNPTIHPQYNHTVTRTRRLSSSNPNGQNISNKGEVE